jgi:hypothetical protein
MAEPARKVEVEYEDDGRSDDGDFSSGAANDSQLVSDPGATGTRGFSKDRSHYLRDRLAREIKTKNESFSAYIKESESFLKKIGDVSAQNNADAIKNEIAQRSVFIKDFSQFQLAVKTLEVELEKMKRNTWENHGENQHLEKLEVERRRLLNPSRGYYAPDEFILKKLEKEIIGIKRDEKRHSKEVFSQTSGTRYDNQLILNQEHLVTEAKKMMVDFYRNDRALQNAFSRRIPQPKAPINDTDHATSVPQYDNKTAEAPALETDTEAPYTPPAYQPNPYTATPSSLGTGGFVAPPGPTNSFGAANDNQPSPNRPPVTTQQSGDRQTAARSTPVAPGANDNSPAQPGASKVTAIPSSKNTSVASRTPRNTSPVRKVETEYTPETRPRDAAIRQNRAANDNYRTPANYNENRSGMRATVSQEFNETYKNAGLQPTLNTQLQQTQPDDEPQRTSRFSEQKNIGRVQTTSEPIKPIRKVARKNVSKIVNQILSDHADVLEADDVQLLVNEPAEKPQFPFLIVFAAIAKDILDFLEFTIIGMVLTFPLSFILALTLFVWCLGKISGGWWKKKLISWLWKRYILTILIEFIPFCKIIPATTIFVLMAHYRETKIVKTMNQALEELKDAGIMDLIK